MLLKIKTKTATESQLESTDQKPSQSKAKKSLEKSQEAKKRIKAKKKSKSKSETAIEETIASVQAKNEFKTPEELGEPLKYDLYLQGVTQSKITNFRSCERKFRLDNMGLSSMSESQALIYGTVFHEALDKAQNQIKNGMIKKYEDFDFEKIMDELEEFFEDDYLNSSPEGKVFYEMSYSWAAVTLPEYFKFWKSDYFGEDKKEFVEIEKEFKVGVKGHEDKPVVPLRGKRDGIIRQEGELWLLENKTKGQWNEAVLSQIVERDLQNNTYILAATEEYEEPIVGVLYNIIRRPQLRKKAKETMREFMVRCRDDIQSRPEWYFVRLAVEIDEDTRTKFKFQLTRQVKLIQDWYHNHFDNPEEDIENTAQCQGTYGTCKFLNMCCSNLKDCTGLYIKDKFFPELEDANNETSAVEEGETFKVKCPHCDNDGTYVEQDVQKTEKGKEYVICEKCSNDIMFL